MSGRLPRLDPARAGFVEDFRSGALDPDRWVDHYLPQWTTPERSRARCDVGPSGLRLRIDADQPDWRAEDAPLRVSNLQTATFGGPVGSTRGTHRHRPDGLVVRTAVAQRILWAPRSGAKSPALADTLRAPRGARGRPVVPRCAGARSSRRPRVLSNTSSRDASQGHTPHRARGVVGVRCSPL